MFQLSFHDERCTINKLNRDEPYSLFNLGLFSSDDKRWLAMSGHSTDESMTSVTDTVPSVNWRPEHATEVDFKGVWEKGNIFNNVC